MTGYGHFPASRRPSGVGTYALLAIFWKGVGFQTMALLWTPSPQYGQGVDPAGPVSEARQKLIINPPVGTVTHWAIISSSSHHHCAHHVVFFDARPYHTRFMMYGLSYRWRR